MICRPFRLVSQKKTQKKTTQALNYCWLYFTDLCFLFILKLWFVYTSRLSGKLFISRSLCRWQESEKLESLNAELKAQIEELKNQKQQLVYMLNLHRPTCIVRAHNGQTPEDERNLFIQQIKETTLQCMNFTATGSPSPAVLTACERLWNDFLFITDFTETPQRTCWKCSALEWTEDSSKQYI